MISHAAVATDRPDRYAKQLVSHLSRKVEAEEIEHGHRLTFARDGQSAGAGDVLVLPGRDELVLVAIADDPERLAVVQDVLARHLVRFASQDELSVTWADGDADRG